MAAADAELAQPPPDPGLVAVGADLAVSGESFLQVADRLLPVALPAAQDAQVFRRRCPGPRVGMPRGGLGDPGRVLTGQAAAVRRRRGQGRESGIAGREGFGAAADVGGQLAVAYRQRAAAAQRDNGTQRSSDAGGRADR